MAISVHLAQSSIEYLISNKTSGKNFTSVGIGTAKSNETRYCRNGDVRIPAHDYFIHIRNDAIYVVSFH